MEQRQRSFSGSHRRTESHSPGNRTPTQIDLEMAILKQQLKDLSTKLDKYISDSNERYVNELAPPPEEFCNFCVLF
jgi:hypothetical protein